MRQSIYSRFTTFIRATAIISGLGFSSACQCVAQTASAATPPAGQSPTAAITYPFQDPSLPTEQRIDNLISLMTLDEKIACLSTFTRIPRLGVTGTQHAEGLHGLSMGGPRTAGFNRPPAPPVGAPAAGAPPPAGRAFGVPGARRFTPITTTIFPQSFGMGETWDPAIVEAAGAEEGFEARYISQNPKYNRIDLIVMAPNADLGRDPRWGRTEECFGEDPFFNGTMAVAMVKGLQGDNPKYWLAAALLKHFLANSKEDNRSSFSATIDERLLREYYSVPFRMGIEEGGARAFMTAYNAVNGIPCAVQPFVENMAVKEWGEDGIICSDGGAIGQMVTDHKYFPDVATAAAAAIKSGITKFLENGRPAVEDALSRNLLTGSDLDNAMRGNFRVLIKLGLLDPPSMNPYAAIGSGPEPWLDPKNQALVERATEESVVLLKNRNNLLPLDRHTIHSIAMIGPRASGVILDWYSGLPPFTVSPLQGIENKLGPDVVVRYAPDNTGNQAARLARMSDVAIVCVGNHPYGGDNSKWGQVEAPSEGREAVDRQSITLEQEDLIKQVHLANPKTVVVLISSFPYAIDWSQANVPAIVHLTQCSEELGNGLADVLFGDYDPSGRTTETWPASLSQLPPMDDFDIRHGHTYMYFKGTPLYPFGYGLSYTTFGYANLRTSTPTIPASGTTSATVDVTNNGKRAGDEVVEMYVRYLDSAVSRPNEQLVGFERLPFQPSQTRAVTIPLKAEQLAYWNVAKHKFVVEPGTKIELMIGRSSANILLRKTIAIQ